MPKLVRIVLYTGLCITFVSFLLLAGFAIKFCRQITPMAVVNAALGADNDEYVSELFLNRTYGGNANFSFDYKNCVNNHHDLPRYGYLVVSARMLDVNEDDFRRFTINKFKPEAIVEVIIYDPFVKTNIKTKYPCYRKNFFWYILDSWINSERISV